MPIYEYQCDDCGHRSEAIQRLSEEPLTVCLECGGSIRRLISAPAVQFKGTGWYVTDYGGRGGGDKSSGASKKEGSSATEGGGEGEPASSKEAAKSSEKNSAR